MVPDVGEPSTEGLREEKLVFGPDAYATASERAGLTWL
jgi:hypothetical protein